MIDFFELENEIYSRRLIVLLETEPQSDLYEQVMLDDKHFKDVSFAINPESATHVELELGDEKIKLPDLQQIKFKLNEQ